jgi:ATP-dependent Clp protease protease subunit
MGNDTDMVAMSALLTKIDGQIANIYSAKTGKPVAEMLAQMAAETWFTADEAVAAKMADQVADPDADAGATARAEQLARLNMMRRTFQLAEFADV